MWQVSEHDAKGNASQGDVLMQDSSNTLVHATSRLVTTVGVDNVVVVETPDAVLVADRSRSQAHHGQAQGFAELADAPPSR